jgi:hypothetical protein
MPVGHARSGFYLDKHEVSALSSNNVYLATSTTPIAVKDSKPSAHEVSHGNVFSALTQVSLMRLAAGLCHAPRVSDDQFAPSADGLVSEQPNDA